MRRLLSLFALLVARFWHPVYGFTAFFQLDGSNDDLKISAFREFPVYVHRGTGGYDGLYYAQIAQDPTLRNPELPRAMDNFAYRARRILPPALAWLAGLGRPAWVIEAYALLNVVACRTHLLCQDICTIVLCRIRYQEDPYSTLQVKSLLHLKCMVNAEPIDM